MISHAPISEAPFVRRKNYDSTEVSICMSCFLTINRGNEETLEDAEQKHDCDRAIQEECARYENSQRGTF